MKTVKCPFCETEFKTKKKWSDCDTCGNNFSTKKYEVEK